MIRAKYETVAALTDLHIVGKNPTVYRLAAKDEDACDSLLGVIDMTSVIDSLTTANEQGRSISISSSRVW
jgi:hypothetical protein